MTNNRGVLRSMPDKSQICVCLSNYEHHCHKHSWDIIVLYFPTIMVNIRHIQLCEAGYLMLISVFIFSFSFHFFLWCRLAPGQSRGGECKGPRSGPLQCGCDILGNPGVCYQCYMQSHLPRVYTTSVTVLHYIQWSYLPLCDTLITLNKPHPYNFLSIHLPRLTATWKYSEFLQELSLS